MGGEDKYDQPMWSAVLAGTIGGGVAVVVGYPFETVKVRLQTGTTRHLFRDLFSGVTAPLTTVTPAWAIMYAAYYGAQSWLATKAHWELSPVAKGAVSGALCGFATAADGPHSTQNQGGRGVWPAGGGGGEVATATVGSNSTVGCEVS